MLAGKLEKLNHRFPLSRHRSMMMKPAMTTAQMSAIQYSSVMTPLRRRLNFFHPVDATATSWDRHKLDGGDSVRGLNNQNEHCYVPARHCDGGGCSCLGICLGRREHYDWRNQLLRRVSRHAGVWRTSGHTRNRLPTYRAHRCGKDHKRPSPSAVDEGRTLGGPPCFRKNLMQIGTENLGWNPKNLRNLCQAF